MPYLRSEFNKCLLHSSSALHRMLEQLAEEHFKQVELSSTQGFILITLKKAPGITVSDLAQVHQLVSSTITRTLDKLEAAGFVQRESFGKITRVFATEKGKRKEADAKAAWKKLRHQYGQLIGVEAAQHLAELISKAIAALEEGLPR